MAKIIWHNERRAIRELIPYEVNPRQITDKQAKDLKASLAKFGIADPIIINTDNMIIGGHQRMKILETLLGYEPDFQIDVRVPDRELSIDEVRELNVRLNKNVAEWDFDTLANNFELDDLLDWGFDKKELDLDLWAGDAPEDVEPQIDKAEELRVKWGVESGQLWQLGEHRIICGDCTDRAVVERVMGGEKAQLIPTSPPYFVGKEYEKDFSWDDFTHLIDGFIMVGVEFLESGGYLFVNFAENTDKPIAMAELYRATATSYGLQWHAHRVWKRPAAMPIYVSTSPRPVGEIEYLHTYRKGSGKETVRNISISHKMLWETGGPEQLGHKAAFPVEFVEKPIVIYSDVGGVIYDPFLGSGTTLIACERLGRKCRAVEISPAYVAVAIQRWVDVTGGVPELIDSNTII